MTNPIQAFFSALLVFVLATAVRRGVALVVIGATLGTMPMWAQAEVAIVAAAAKIADYIANTLGPILSRILGAANAILGLINAFRALWEQVVYPIIAIFRARALASALAAAFRGLLASLLWVDVSSATLPGPIALETIARNRSTVDFAALDAAFQGVYRPVPASALAHGADRDLIDMDDASAKAMLKTLKESEQAIEQATGAAERIVNEARLQAPGTAGYVAGNGIVGAVHSQAMMMRMIAAEMRQEAAQLAHDSARRKRKAVFSEEFRRASAGVLKR